MTVFEQQLERLVLMLCRVHAPHSTLGGQFCGDQERLQEKIRGVVQTVVAYEQQVTESHALTIMRNQPHRAGIVHAHSDPESIELPFRLLSYESGEDGTRQDGVNVTLIIGPRSITLGTRETYGTLPMQEGAGEPLFIEHFEGDLRLVAWADINKEDPTHTISFKDARETNRRAECQK